MPGYKGHLVGGLTTGLIIHTISTSFFNLQLSVQQFFFAMVCALLGALFPDIDTTSMGQKLFYLGFFGTILFSIFTCQWHLLVALSILAIFPLFLSHRGIMHSPWFCALAPAGCLFFSPLLPNNSFFLYAYFVAGTFSHLLLDFGPKKFIQKFFFLS